VVIIFAGDTITKLLLVLLKKIVAHLKYMMSTETICLIFFKVIFINQSGI